MIYFLDLNGLTEHLKQKKNTEYESFQYTIAFLIINCISSDVYLGREAIPAGDLGAILSVFAMGVLYAAVGFFIVRSYYRSNGGEKGEFFLHRTLSLSWVIGWRIFLVMAPVLVLFYFLKESSSLGMVLVLTICAIGSALYYLTTMNKTLKKISQATTG